MTEEDRNQSRRSELHGQELVTSIEKNISKDISHLNYNRGYSYANQSGLEGGGAIVYQEEMLGMTSKNPEQGYAYHSHQVEVRGRTLKQGNEMAEYE